MNHLALSVAVALIAPSLAFAQECPVGTTTGIPAATLIKTGGESTAYAEFCGSEAGYDELAYAELSDGTSAYLFHNHESDAGDTVDIGAFAAGDEIVFYIYVENTGDYFYSGPGSRNTDGIVHAAITELAPGVFNIGFEDIWGSGDTDYNDIAFNVYVDAVISDPGCDDLDEDKVCDDVDNCPGLANDQADYDKDGLGDLCDPCKVDPENDADKDKVCESDDNCPSIANDQTDSDKDGEGDACDLCVKDPYNDEDGDLICGDVDYCGDTGVEIAPTVRLNTWHWVDADMDGIFETTPSNGKGNGPGRSYTLEDTAGCNCTQIIEALHLGEGMMKFGCPIGIMDNWVRLMNE